MLQNVETYAEHVEATQRDRRLNLDCNCLVSRSGCELENGPQRISANIASAESGAWRALVVEMGGESSPPLKRTNKEFSRP